MAKKNRTHAQRQAWATARDEGIPYTRALARVRSSASTNTDGPKTAQTPDPRGSAAPEAAPLTADTVTPGLLLWDNSMHVMVKVSNVYPGTSEITAQVVLPVPQRTKVWRYSSSDLPDLRHITDTEADLYDWAWTEQGQVTDTLSGLKALTRAVSGHGTDPVILDVAAARIHAFMDTPGLDDSTVDTAARLLNRLAYDQVHHR